LQRSLPDQGVEAQAPAR